jgi:ATP-dependent RNA helicase DeaD
LIRDTALKLSGLRTVIVSAADELLVVPGAEGDLAAIMAEVPKESDRTIVARVVTPAVDEFVERYARRPRRVSPPTTPEVAGGESAPPAGPTAVRYVSVSASSRLATLRALLDELDPPSATIHVRTDDSARAVKHALRTLGYQGDHAPIRLGRGAVAEHSALVVLYDVPLDAAELSDAVRGAPAQVIALAQPREVARLREAAGPRAVAALALGAIAARARAHEDSLRAELREILSAGAPSRDIVALEPLLTDFDAVEIAAAALHLYERTRHALTRALAANVPAPALAITYPDRDARPRGDDRPRRDTRPSTDRPSTDRPSTDRPRRDDRPRGGDDRPPRRDRPFAPARRGSGPPRDDARPGSRPPRSGPPRSGPPRSGPPRDRGERGERPAGGPRGEWAERGEKLRHSRRPPRRDDR